MEVWTERAVDQLCRAIDEAKRRCHALVEPEHLVWSDLQDEVGLIARAAVLEAESLAKVKAVIDRRLRSLRIDPGGVRRDPEYSADVKELLAAARESSGCGDGGALDWDSIVEALASLSLDVSFALREAGVDIGRVESLVSLEKNHAAGGLPSAIPKSDVLGKFCTNLTRLAADGRLEPVIGRDDEIEEVITIVAQKVANNPALLGKPGVGKTAIVEGLAIRIEAGEVPILEGKEVLVLDLGSLLAGASYRGEFEDRVKKVIQAVTAAPDRYILFIDEIHTLMGAGRGSEGPDAANLLKPALARGELRLIGATTFAEYKLHLEKDGAFARRFQRVTVKEPDAAQTEEIIRGIRERFEEHHGVRYRDEALTAIIRMAERYVAGNNPDKAIKILDRTGAMAAVRRAGDAQRSTVVDEGLVTEAVAKITGIPRSRIEQSEVDLLPELAGRLETRLVGQSRAIDQLASRLRFALSDFRRSNRPRGIILLRGPRGSGKTTMAETVGSVLCPTREHVVKIDLSGFTESHAVSRLIGSPPGYQGHGEGGFLTEAVWHFPSSLVLLENCEQAHADVMRVFFSIFDEGRLVDTSGKDVDFRQCLFFMTLPSGDHVDEAVASRLREVADDTIELSALGKEQLPSLVHVVLRDCLERLSSSTASPDGREHRLNLEIDPAAERVLAETYDPASGVTTLVQYVEEQIISELLRKYPKFDPAEARGLKIGYAAGRFSIDPLPDERKGAA